MPDTDRFDWSDDPSVIVPQQLPIAVFKSGNGDLIIRQRSSTQDGTDPQVIIPAKKVRAFRKAVLAAMRDDG